MKAKEMKKELAKKSQDEIVSLVNSSIEMLKSLAEKYDTIRHNYWNYLIGNWKQEFSEYL